MGVIKKFTTKVGEWLSGESANNPTEKEDSKLGLEEPVNGDKKEGEESPIEKKKPLPNSVQNREIIKKATLSLLNSLYLSNSNTCKTKHLIVWLDTDKTTFNSYADFGQELEEYWAVESGYAFKKVDLRNGKPKDEKEARKLDISIESISVFLQEQEVDLEKPVIKKARISIMGDKGSLSESEYELSSDVLEREHRKYYNIGRSEYPTLESGGYRHNHIVIKDDDSCNANKFVSRAHARIGYAENIGFFLQVEYGGSRLSGNRTRIFRDEEKIEVENVEVKVPLHDGDLIELGKAVVLKFEEKDK